MQSRKSCRQLENFDLIFANTEAFIAGNGRGTEHVGYSSSIALLLYVQASRGLYFRLLSGHLTIERCQHAWIGPHFLIGKPIRPGGGAGGTQKRDHLVVAPAAAFGRMAPTVQR